MVLVTLVLFCCGLAAIYSASASFASGDAVSGFVVRQCVWGALGACAYLAVVKLDYRNAMRFAWPMFGAMLAMLMLLLIIGHTAKGAQSWFNLGFFRFQPSELGKVVFALVMAKLCTALPPYTVKGLAAALAAAGSIMALVMLQPDLGSTLVYAVMLAAVLIAAGTPVKVLAGMAAAGLAMLPLGWMVLKPYQRMRLLVFIDPSIDPQGAGYNVIQSRGFYIQRILGGVRLRRLRRGALSLRRAAAARARGIAVHEGRAREADVRRYRRVALVPDFRERRDEHGARARDGAASAALQLRRQLAARHLHRARPRAERAHSGAARTLLRRNKRFLALGGNFICRE